MTAVLPMPSEVRYVQGYELRAAEADGRYLECRVTVYDEENDVGPFYESMAPGVFARTITEHRDSVKLVVGHDTSVPAVGTPVDWQDTDTELRAVYKFLSHREAKLAARMADEKAFGGVSVGFLPGRRPQHNTWSRDEDGNIHVVRHEARLLHVGMVVTPAVENAKILQVRSMGVPEDVLVRTPRLDDARKILERIKAGKVELP